MSCACRTLQQHISLSQVRRTLKIGAFKVEAGSRILKEEAPERAITKCIIVGGGLPYPFISPLSLQLVVQAKTRNVYGVQSVSTSLCQRHEDSDISKTLLTSLTFGHQQ